MPDREPLTISRFDSIRTRLTVAFVLIVLLPMVIISAVLAISGSEGARAQLAGGLEMAASFKENALTTWAETLEIELGNALIGDDTFQHLNAFLREPHDSRGHLRAHRIIEGRFAQLMTQTRRFEAIFMMDTRGEVIATSENELSGRTFGDQPFFRRGLTGPAVQLYHAGTTSIIASRPVIDNDGRLLGVLAGRINLASLSGIMDFTTGLGRTGKAYIVSTDQTLLTPLPAVAPGTRVDSQGIRAVLKDKTRGTAAYHDFRGVPVIGTYRWLPKLGVAIVAEQDQAESSSALYVILAVNASVALAAVLIAAFASLGVTRSIATPLSDFAETAGQIASGRLDLTVKAKRRDEIGALAQTFNFMTDKLKQTLEGLRMSETNYRGIFENALEGIIQTTFEGAITNANPAMARILGYDSPEDLRASVTGMRQLYANPDERTTFLAALAEHGEVLGREVQFTRKDGRMIWLSISARLVRDEAGKPAYIEGLCADITERKHAVEAFLKLNEELEQRVIERTSQLATANDEMKQLTRRLEGAYSELQSAQSRILQQEKMASIGQLAAGVAHEINNPMGFIMSNLSSLHRYTSRIADFVRVISETIEQSAIRDREHYGELYETIVKQKTTMKLDYILADLDDLIRESLEGADRVKRIVQDLKSFSRIDDSGLAVCDINAGIDSTITIVWNELKYKASLKKELGDIPPTKCNLGQLNQVFMNMLINAAHAIETQGEIRIKTWSDDTSIFVRISDNGQGIPPDGLARIFEPFYTTKEVGKGTGLGLSIAYDIVKKHNGTIHVESEVGKGTTFTIAIPIVRE